MSYITIRKNARQKIRTALDAAAGIIFRTSHSDMSDGFDNEYRLATPTEALAWLADADNYADARVLREDDELRISGPYYFCDKFTAYATPEAFEAAQVRVGLKAAPVAAAPAPRTLPAGVVDLAAYRAARAS